MTLPSGPSASRTAPLTVSTNAGSRSHVIAVSNVSLSTPIAANVSRR